jgi:putative PIN family toxin of toxin-antitoxin system
VRVVFDTNVLVSALVTPGGKGEAALLRVISGHDELILSRPIILELLDVLARKFDRYPDELSRVALLLSDVATVVDPEIERGVLGDEPDNRILECALAGAAEAIVTGDRAMLELGSFEGVAILGLAEYVGE